MAGEPEQGGGVVNIVNLTPHAITIPGTALAPEHGDWTLPPSGSIARAAELHTPAGDIEGIPVTRVAYGTVEGLPDPEWVELPSPCSDVDEACVTCPVCGATGGHHPPPRSLARYYVVSSITADAIRRSGRTTEDILVPGQQIRDEAGRIIGCRSLCRVA